MYNPLNNKEHKALSWYQRSLGLLVISAVIYSGFCRDVYGTTATENPRALHTGLQDPNMTDAVIALNFENMDIRTVLKTIGEITGINFVLDESIHGQATVMSPSEIRLGDVYSVLESILEVNGYAAIPIGDIVKIVPKGQASQYNLPVHLGSDPDTIPISDTIITQIMPLTTAKATEVSQIVQPLLSPDAKIAAYAKTNSLVITDISAKINYVATIVQQLEGNNTGEQIHTIPLTYASAELLSEQIGRILNSTANQTTAMRGQHISNNIDDALRILPDTRTNSLVVFGNPHDIQTVTALVKKLDIPRPQGSQKIHVVYLKNAQAKEVADSLGNALSNLRITGGLQGDQPVQVTADEGTNGLIIAALAQDFEVIQDIIDQLDIVREQVLVEMLIVEVSEDRLSKIGIDWATMDQAVADSVHAFGSTNFGPRVDFLNGELEGLAVGAWKDTGGSHPSIGAILHALDRESGVNILSRPNITTSNHQKASIIVGENRPFVTDSRITDTDPATPTVIKSYEYKDVGIRLDIIPHVSQGGLVRLEIESEFTKLVSDVTTTVTDTPTTAKRQAQTVISMQSGSTAVIGGMLRDDKIVTQNKIPLLGDLPLLGPLFRYQTDQIEKTNLLIFITPHVMNNQAQLDNITRQKKQDMETVTGQTLSMVPEANEPQT